jgi:hypothetical protein
VKVVARKGVTIVYPVKVEDPDGRSRQVVDFIPPDRDAFLVWRDQFGSIHGVGFGDVDTDPAFDGETVAGFVERAMAVISPPDDS